MNGTKSNSSSLLTDRIDKEDRVVDNQTRGYLSLTRALSYNL